LLQIDTPMLNIDTVYC